ncbi:MAG: DNA polymerase III subunit alpha [Planctomycetota bacterium]
MVRFAHLHCHSHFSLLEAPARIDALCDAAVAANQDRLALTDHGNMFGAIQFHKKARARNITPILGCEMNVAAEDHTSREQGQPVHHLTLLAENYQGYSNLIKLVSRGYLDGFYFVPRVDRGLLRNHASGLIALSGCMSGELSKKILAGDSAGAERLVHEYREIFGKDNYFIEIMENEIPLQRRQREGLMEIARRTGTEMVLTNNVHYLKPEHVAAREVLMCIGSGKTLEDDRRRHIDTDQQHFRTSEEMATLFRGADRLCEQTYEVALRCNVELPFGEFHLPHFEIKTGEEPAPYFRRLSEEGCERRYGRIDERIRKRLEHEIEVISEMGFSAYFLIVADFMEFARANDVPVGPGRGSAAGSIVAYALGITDVDPLKYNLLFERFLNRGRVSMPDIDIDFCRDRRERVIQYVQEKYGRDCVCQIVTFGTLAARAAIRDTGRVLGIDLGKVDQICKKIPATVGTRLKDALEQDAELRKLREEDPQIDRLFEISLSIEGLNRHASTHAAGVVITDKPLQEYVPLSRVQQEINTQYSMNELESIGLLKMDFLGLKTLTILKRAEELICASGTEVDLEKLPLDDSKTYELLQAGDTTGVFQLESSGMRELLQKMKPDTFEDIVAILALYRPGPLGSGMVDSFVHRKHGTEAIEYPHESLESILKETYGVMVYQEQIMRISNELSGFSLDEADNLRKAMGKKKPEVMAKFETKFIDGAVKRGVDRKVATKIWTDMAFFAGYGFNKSHTVAYGIITYRTAWARANHPCEFLAACMSIDRGDTDKVAVYMDECRRIGIPVLVPDLTKSELDFTISDGAIRFGLGAIKGVGEKPVEAVLSARKRLGRPFRSLLEAFEEVETAHMSRSVHEAFISAGAYDWAGLPRARILKGLESLVKIGQTTQTDRQAGQLALFGTTPKTSETDFRLPEVPEWPEKEKLAREKAVLGFYLSGHPLRARKKTLDRFSTHQLAELTGLADRAEVTVGGAVAGLRSRITRKGRSAGKKMAMFRIVNDDGGSVSAVCFAEDFENCEQHVEDDAICLFSGLIDSSREEPSLRVRRVEPVEQVLARRVDRVILTLEAADEPFLERLRQIVLELPGEVPLYLKFIRPGGDDQLIRCGSSYKIKVTEESLDALGTLVGQDHVRCR